MPFSWYIFPQITGVRGTTPLYNFSCSGDNGGGGSEGGKGMGIVLKQPLPRPEGFLESGNYLQISLVNVFYAAKNTR